MVNCGTIDTDRACIKLYVIKDPLKPVVIKNCAIHAANSYGFYAKSSSYFYLDNNIFHGLIEKGILIDFSHNFNFTNNVISYVDKRKNIGSATPPTNEAFSYFKMGTESARKGIRITDNRMYGYIDIGWVSPGGPCETEFSDEISEDMAAIISAKLESSAFTGDFVFKNNFAMSGKQAL
jgi:hypothetical protein